MTVSPCMVVAVLLLFLCFTSTRCSSLDCRKFVFAPQCRGIIAKRGRIMNPAWSDFNQVPNIDNEYQQAILLTKGDVSSSTPGVSSLLDGLAEESDQLQSSYDNSLLGRELLEYLSQQYRPLPSVQRTTRGVSSLRHHRALGAKRRGMEIISKKLSPVSQSPKKRQKTNDFYENLLNMPILSS